MLARFLAPLGLIIPLQAGGSVPLAHLDPFAEGDTPLSGMIDGGSDWQVHESGIAVRLGDQFQHLAGERVGPYEFLARPQGGTFPTVMFEYQTRPTSVMADGSLVQGVIDPEAVEIAEDLVAIRIRLLSPEELETHRDAFAASDDQAVGAVPAPDRDPAALRAQVRAEVQRIDADLGADEQLFEIQDGEYARLTRAETGTGESRLALTLGSDHSSINYQVWLHADDTPLFTFVTVDSWQFIEGGTPDNPFTEDMRREKRLYFADGRLDHLLTRHLRLTSSSGEVRDLGSLIEEVEHLTIPAGELDQPELVAAIPDRVRALIEGHDEEALVALSEAWQALPRDEPE